MPHADTHTPTHEWLRCRMKSNRERFRFLREYMVLILCINANDTGKREIADCGAADFGRKRKELW
eukprot:7391118-Prymnesium_polylepis.3